MNLDLVRSVIPLDPWDERNDLLHDEETVFWVDWREEDDAIVGYCEKVLSTGMLTAEIVDANNESGFELYISYGDRRIKVPLTYSEQDIALNEALRGDYEVRYCVASDGMDTAAFVPLSIEHWNQLESEFGERVSRHFHVLTDSPNVFTDTLPYARNRIESLQRKPWWKFW